MAACCPVGHPDGGRTAAKARALHDYPDRQWPVRRRTAVPCAQGLLTKAPPDTLIARLLRLPEPMLARSGPLPRGRGWVFEPKLDGFRCLVCTHGGRFRARSRNGWSMTSLLPELEAALPPDVQLDGEIVALDHDGDGGLEGWRNEARARPSGRATAAGGDVESPPFGGGGVRRCPYICLYTPPASDRPKERRVAATDTTR